MHQYELFILDVLLYGAVLLFYYNAVNYYMLQKYLRWEYKMVDQFGVEPLHPSISIYQYAVIYNVTTDIAYHQSRR